MERRRILLAAAGVVAGVACVPRGPNPWPGAEGGAVGGVDSSVGPGADSSIVPATCGNGLREGGEACDGADFGGATCTTLGGFTGGTLACTPACTFDTSACFAGPLPDLVVYAAGLPIGLNVREGATLNVCESALGCGGGGGAPGGRRLLDFTLVSENVGAATLYFGDPSTTASWPPPYTGLWEINACGYRAFHDYAVSWLCPGTDPIACAAPGATRVASGLKESFCFIENFGSAPDWTGAPATCGMYSCGNMGQLPGCADDYYPGLDCQWIDITGLPPGPYVLCAELDPTNRIVEQNETNNIGCAPITIP